MVEGWKEFVIGKSGTLLRESINPELQPNVIFTEYSMPSFDEGKKPVKSYGREMHSNRTVLKDDVLLFNKLNVRKKRVWRLKKTGENSVCSGEFLPYQSDEIDLDLLCQILLSDPVTQYFEERSTGTSNSQKRIRPSVFLDFVIQLPEDMSEQRRMARALSDMDALIETTQKLIDKKKDIKKGIMQELLTGKKRLDEYQGEWVECKLLSLLSQAVTDGPHETPDLVEAGIPFISVDAIVDNKIDFSRMRGYITEEYDLQCCKKYKPQVNDVYLVKSGSTVGKVAIVETTRRFNIWSPLAAMRCNSKTDPHFLYYLLQTDNLQSQVMDKASHGTQPNLSMRQLEKFDVVVPAQIEEQKAIAKVFIEIDADISAYEKLCEKYKGIKAGMVSRLLSGETRMLGEEE